MRILALYIVVFFLAVLCVVGIGAQQGRQADKTRQADEAALKVIDEQLPIVDLNTPKPSEPRARARRLEKDRRHNLHKHAIGERFTIMTTVYEWPENFPPLPVEHSTTIIIGKISEASAHISDDRSGVYSEVVIKVEEVLKHNTGLPAEIVAERDGGRVRLPSGAIFRYIIDGLAIPQVGHRYLLFLKQLEDGDFSIVTGYELLNSRVLPLDTTMPFSKYKDSEESTFLSIVLEQSEIKLLSLRIEHETKTPPPFPSVYLRLLAICASNRACCRHLYQPRPDALFFFRDISVVLHRAGHLRRRLPLFTTKARISQQLN